jgi:DNA-binding XRE family transcriptional regulator
MPTKSWKEIRAERAKRDGPEFRKSVTRERRRAVREIAAYEQTLADLRRARSLTQTTLARTLGCSQAQVSRIENETDLFLSTLQSYLEALGGRLELVGVFDDERVTLKLADLVEA